MQERIISGRQRDEDDDDEPEIHAEYVPDVPEQRGSFEVGSGSGGSGSRVGGEAQSCRFSNMKSFQEGVGSFAEPSAIAGRDRIDGARAIEAAEEEGGDGDVGGGRQPHSSQFRATEEDEVDLLGDLSIRAEGGANVNNDVQFERLMLGPTARSQSMREAPAIASSQPRRKGSHTQSVAPSQAAKGKAVATSQPTKGKGKDIGQVGGPAKGIVIREPTPPAQKKKSWFSWGSKKGKKNGCPCFGST
ncbi:hypothetical protein Taro_009597 [Colocasia esculenta]|uniref:Uncharacterized protein n=1 Tax=Colocasia esculenta TaxID=4460 RepID=A0A843U4G9_COLES|nr:hypothetical protein [Colocasia esculenta]